MAGCRGQSAVGSNYITIILVCTELPLSSNGMALVYWYSFVPGIGIIQAGDVLMADRYTYVPLIGLFIITAWGAPEIFKGRRFKRSGLTVLFLGLIISCMTLTLRQVGYWKNSITLFEHA